MFHEFIFDVSVRHVHLVIKVVRTKGPLQRYNTSGSKIVFRIGNVEKFFLSKYDTSIVKVSSGCTGF